MARYVCVTPTFTTDSFYHDAKCLYQMTCTVMEGLYSTRSQTILNLKVVCNGKMTWAYTLP